MSHIIWLPFSTAATQPPVTLPVAGNTPLARLEAALAAGPDAWEVDRCGNHGDDQCLVIELQTWHRETSTVVAWETSAGLLTLCELKDDELLGQMDACTVEQALVYLSALQRIMPCPVTDQRH
jgi:hypothetical protein